MQTVANEDYKELKEMEKEFRKAPSFWYRLAAVEPRLPFVLRVGRKLLFERNGFLQWARKTDGVPENAPWRPRQ